MEQAFGLLSRGQPVLAAESFAQGLKLQPDSPDALHMLAVCKAMQGDHEGAEILFERALVLAPQNTDLQYNFAESLSQKGDLGRAEALYRQVLAQQPESLPAYEGLIQILQNCLSRLQKEQEKHAAKTGQTSPGSLHTDATTGPASFAQIQHELAILLNNKGNALTKLGQLEQAESAYRSALAHDAQYALPWSNLGNVLHQMGHVYEAESCCRKSLAINSEFADAWNNLGNALADQGRMAESQQCHDRALELNPHSLIIKANHESGTLFNLMIDPQVSYEQSYLRHQEWGAKYPIRKPRNPIKLTELSTQSGSSALRKPLRIAYLSADFRRHAMLHYLEPLLKGHDRQRFEVFAYAQGPGSDDDTMRLQSYPVHWRWITHQTDEQIDQQIRHDQIDILIDCMGHTRSSRIKALRDHPARWQFAWLGYMSGTGLPAIDARLTDQWVDPISPQMPTPEKLIYINGGMLCYSPHGNAPQPEPPPLLQNGYVTFGSLNNIQRLNGSVLQAWGQIMQAVPKSKFLIQSKYFADPGMLGYVRGLFASQNIATDRLILLEANSSFLRTYHQIDVALNTWPYGGGATSCDALWMGVPVLALQTDRPAGQLTVSALNQLACQELCCDSVQEYVHKAIALAQDSNRLAHYRQTLRQTMARSQLGDQPRFVQQFEHALLQAIDHEYTEPR